MALGDSSPLGVKMNPPSLLQNEFIAPYPDRLPLPVLRQHDLRGHDEGQRKPIARVQVSYKIEKGLLRIPNTLTTPTA